MTEPRKSVVALGVLGCVLLALNGIGVVLQRHGNLPWFIAVALSQGIGYVTAIWVVCRTQPRRELLVLILIIAGLLRLSILYSPPFLSDDIYRYIWDGRVQAAGVNPYRFVPAHKSLAALRDDAIYPHINRRDYARTIYPPVAQVIFLSATRISESVTWMKAVMVGFEAVAVWLLIKLLIASGLPAERVLIYAWHPLAIWEIAGSGHIEAAAVLLLALALWSRKRDLRALGGAALAGAALIKLFPAVLFAAFYRRWDWKMPLTFAGIVLLAYLPYASVGSGALGFLPVYFQEEGLLHGWGVFPLSLGVRLLGLPESSGRVYLLFAAAVLLGVGLWSIFRRPVSGEDSHLSDAITLVLVFTLLVSPHYPWYFLWLVPILCFRLYLPALYLTVASFVLYELLLQTNGEVFFRINVLLYVPFALLVLICCFASGGEAGRQPVQVAFPEESRSATCVPK
jgi:alpha-1,6-mannosyltransferase